MTDDTCNGWSNRETWSVMLHVNNDEGLYESAREVVQRETEYQFQKDEALRDWAETLFTRAGYVDEFGSPWPDALADIACEIGSLDRVNWSECVESLLSD